MGGGILLLNFVTYGTRVELRKWILPLRILGEYLENLFSDNFQGNCLIVIFFQVILKIIIYFCYFFMPFFFVNSLVWDSALNIKKKFPFSRKCLNTNSMGFLILLFWLVSKILSVNELEPLLYFEEDKEMIFSKKVLGIWK